MCPCNINKCAQAHGAYKHTGTKAHGHTRTHEHTNTRAHNQTDTRAHRHMRTPPHGSQTGEQARSHISTYAYNRTSMQYTVYCIRRAYEHIQVAVKTSTEMRINCTSIYRFNGQAELRPCARAPPYQIKIRNTTRCTQTHGHRGTRAQEHMDAHAHSHTGAPTHGYTDTWLTVHIRANGQIEF